LFLYTLGNLIKNTFINFYEDSFRLVMANLVWSFLIGLIAVFSYSVFQVGMWGLLIFPFFLSGPLFVSGMYIALDSHLERQLRVLDLFRGYKKYFWRGVKSFCFSGLIYLILILDVYFFLQIEMDSAVLYFLFIIILFIFVVFSMMQLYFWSLLVMYPEEGIFTLIRRSFVLTFDNLIFSLFWFLFFGLFFGLLVYLRLAFFPFFITLPGLYVIKGTTVMLQKY